MMQRQRDAERGFSDMCRKWWLPAAGASPEPHRARQLRMPTEHDKREYPLYVYEFRYRCERIGKWRKARYRAELHEIQERYAEFEVVGEPMVIRGPAETFNPFR